MTRGLWVKVKRARAGYPYAPAAFCILRAAPARWVVNALWLPENGRRWRAHRQPRQSTIQVSLVPPPCDELTTSEPSCNATRVSPPATIVTVLPDSTNGRRSIWRGAMPASTKVGHADNASVGCAI